MVNYKDLGLVNTRDMFAKAIKGGYAIPAFNFNNMEQMQAIIKPQRHDGHSQPDRTAPALGHGGPADPHLLQRQIAFV